MSVAVLSMAVGTGMGMGMCRGIMRASIDHSIMGMCNRFLAAVMGFGPRTAFRHSIY